jgi:hypothetical protein
LSSNSTELLATISPELQETQHALTDRDSDIVRTLGLIWRPSSDQFQITSGNTSHLIAEKGLITKRFILSKISSIFDPLGLLSPVVILFKLFMQRSWQEGSNWDDPLTPTFLKEWQSISNQLPAIMEIDIPRLVLAQDVPKNIQIHGFSDASEKAYGACIYIRSNNQEGKTTVKILCAKSRVSPLKQVSLPRLEICGAVLIARLLKKKLDSTQWINVNITLWTDSTIVLAWISTCHTRWKTFIANRVAKT